MADFSLPRWLDQSNTDLVPNAMAKGAAVGASIAQIKQAGQRLALMAAEDARQQQEFAMKAQAEAMRYRGFQNFARDREILKAQGISEEDASQQALMKNVHLFAAGDPRALAAIVDRSQSQANHAERIGLQRENLGLQRSRLEEAALAARERNALASENLDLRKDKIPVSEQEIQSQLAMEKSIAEAKTPEEKAQAMRAAELGIVRNFKQAMEFTTGYDDQGRPIFRAGPPQSPTVSSQSLGQKNLNIAEKNYQLLDSLDKNLRDSDLGVRGVLGEVVDRYAPQFGLPGFDPKRATNREVLKVSVQGMVRQISSDQRFTNEDRKRAEDAMVTFGTGENKERATQVLRVLKDVIVSRAKIDAATAGMSQPEWTMSKDEITMSVKTGKMTKEKAIELRQKYYPQDYGPPSP